MESVCGSLISKPAPAVGHGACHIYIVRLPPNPLVDGLLLLHPAVTGISDTLDFGYFIRINGSNRKENRNDTIGVTLAAEISQAAYYLPGCSSFPIVVHTAHYHQKLWCEGENLTFKTLAHSLHGVTAEAEIFHRHGAVAFPVKNFISRRNNHRAAPMGYAVTKGCHRSIIGDFKTAWLGPLRHSCTSAAFGKNPPIIFS